MGFLSPPKLSRVQNIRKPHGSLRAPEGAPAPRRPGLWLSSTLGLSAAPAVGWSPAGKPHVATGEGAGDTSQTPRARSPVWVPLTATVPRGAGSGLDWTSSPHEVSTLCTDFTETAHGDSSPRGTTTWGPGTQSRDAEGRAGHNSQACARPLEASWASRVLGGVGRGPLSQSPCVPSGQVSRVPRVRPHRTAVPENTSTVPVEGCHHLSPVPAGRDNVLTLSCPRSYLSVTAL